MNEKDQKETDKSKKKIKFTYNAKFFFKDDKDTDQKEEKKSEDSGSKMSFK